MKQMMPQDWQKVLEDELSKEYIQKLERFLAKEIEHHTVYPPQKDWFSAFYHTPWQSVRVLLLGQDPYHGEGQAHGLCFSVSKEIPPPPSLKNIFKELKSDLDLAIPEHGHLVSWAKQGILMLNTVLTVRHGQAASHRNQGWERLTDRIITLLSEKKEHMVFILWGNEARKKKKWIDSRHAIVESAHPSPLSVYRGFSGSRPFSKVNQALMGFGYGPIDWCLQ